LQHRPKVIFLHQWNEYSGQQEGHGMGSEHNIYLDTYSVELSDDLEPVSLTAPGYRGDRGGWGFYYLNLTQALMDLYRGRAGESTIMAVSSPLRGEIVSGEWLKVSWSVIGAPAENFQVAIDGKVMVKRVKGAQVEISLLGLQKGPHTLSVAAEGAVTRYPLSCTEMDEPLSMPIPVQVNLPFVLG
jgi:hypothetical protein